MTTKKTAAATAKSSARKLPTGGKTISKARRNGYGTGREKGQARMIVTKSEALRAGLKKLAELDAPQLKQAPGSLEKLKTGRPLKH